MKLIIISPFQFRLNRGIERFTYSLANALAAQHFNVTIYVWSPVHEIVSWGPWHSNIRIRKVPAARYFQSFLASMYYRFWLKKDNPHAVLLNFLYHGENKLPGNLRYLTILHNPASLIPGRYNFIHQQLFHFPSMEFVAVSKRVAWEALPYLAGREITTIYNGVDTQLFKPSTNKAQTTGKQVKIITAAALEERKGMQHLITALGKMNENVRHEIRYDIYGEGDYKNDLQKLIIEYHLEEMVTIKKPVNNLHEILPCYDLFCLLSKGEGMGIAVLEAMACGLSLLTSDCPPFDEYISADIGVKINPENHGELMQYVLNFKNANRNNNRPGAARSKSILFDWEVASKKYAQLLLES